MRKKLLFLAVAFASACEKGPCSDDASPAEGTCTCSDGTVLKPTQCDACRGFDPIDLGAPPSADVSSSTTPLCKRELTFEIEENAAVQFGLSNDAQTVTAVIERDETGVELGRLSATAANGGHLTLPLERGTYRTLVTAGGPSAFRFEMNASVYEPQEVDPEPGADKYNAHDLGPIELAPVRGGYVGTTDREDYYRFTLPQSASVRYALINVLGNVQAQLFPDTAILNENDPYAKLDVAGMDDSRLIVLERGNYYIRVLPNNVSSLYQLQAIAEPYGGDEPNPDPGEDWSAAHDLGVLSVDPVALSGYVGGTDSEDIFRFEVATNDQIAYTLANVMGYVRAEVFKNAKQINPTSFVDRMDAAEGADDAFGDPTLDAGVHYLKITALRGSNSLYTLVLGLNEE